MKASHSELLTRKYFYNNFILIIFKSCFKKSKDELALFFERLYQDEVEDILADMESFQKNSEIFDKVH